MIMSRIALRLVRSLLAEQQEGSDYDALYFGLQDVEMLLEDEHKFRRQMSPQQGKDPIFKKKPKQKRKRRQSPKQKLLSQLTDKKWKQYRKGSGMKTYIEIRAQVSRSQDYKRKAKRLK